MTRGGHQEGDLLDSSAFPRCPVDLGGLTVIDDVIAVTILMPAESAAGRA